MSRSRQYHSNFSAGVISPQAEARIDSTSYSSGLSEGKNILIQTSGGMTRRPGSKFIRDYGALEYVRIFPFIFNTEQKYVVVMYLNAGLGLVDIYKDNTLVESALVVPYTTKEQMQEVDFAQSADSMVMTQGDFTPQLLRRLGDHTQWEILDVPIINPPCESMMCVNDANPDDQIPPTCADGSIPYCETGKCADDSDPTCESGYTLTEIPIWSDKNGYPRYCTFHQGRLWFANNYVYPQSVWSSKAQDFFNFDVGVGDPADSVQETLDTDFINPITSIYSAGKLQVFTSGAEFVNSAAVITPTTSAWARQTTYGSSSKVRPISIDGSTLFLDNTERIIRALTYTDDLKGYDSPSISSESEHLIKAPIDMGAMRGDIRETSNFIYVVNTDGTMAVLNFSRSYKMNAWVEWTTQGFYSQVMDLSRELYILVKRYIDNSGTLELHWMLERLEKAYLTDSGNVIESLSQTSLNYVGKNESNFFGVYYPPNDNTGKVVIVEEGIVVYKADHLKENPLGDVMTAEDIRYSAGNVFDTDENVRALYFDEEQGYRWYMHTVHSVQLENNAQNYIDGLNHLINQSAVAVLDGKVFDDLYVEPGDPYDTVKATYPDGYLWQFDETAGSETYLRKESAGGSTIYWEGWYQGTHYPDLEETPWGLLISGNAGEAGSEYLQIGSEASFDEVVPPVFVTSNKTIKAGVDVPFSKELRICMVGGGGSGRADSNDPAAGGYAGEVVSDVVTLVKDEDVAITIGTGGYACEEPCSIPGTASKFGTYFTANGGAGGDEHHYYGNGAERTTCGGTGYDGLGCGGIGGGQSSGFSNGGNATCSGANGGAGGVGSGGGGTGYCDPNSNAGPGGRGQVNISWTGNYRVGKYRTRKMVLVHYTTTDGIVFFPNDPFVTGEAGLFFDVKATTLPINVNAGGGSRINEPKRIISVTAKFVETRGIDINGVMIPERDFGDEVLDTPPPLRTGTNKIRFLGYNRDTRIYISQDVPMPMTLLSLDIDVNY